MSQPRDYLTTADVASMCGVRPVTIRAYEARGQMPPSNVCPCCGLGPVWSALVIREWIDGRRTAGR